MASIEVATHTTQQKCYDTFSPGDVHFLNGTPSAPGHKKKFHERYHPSAYKTEKLAKYDDIDIVKPWHRKLLLVQPIILTCAIIAYFFYFGYRILCNYRYQTLHDGLHMPSWAFTVAEAVLQLPTILWMTVLLLSHGDRKRPKLRLRGPAVPTVDVLLTTCGESLPIILNTIRAACTLDYPASRCRVIVCDDGADADLEAAVKLLKLEYPHLFYQARKKRPGVPHHYKAGNLQSGVVYTAALPGGPAEYLATLDADMIPARVWLRALLPHLLRDPQLALISPPQTFWNLPPKDWACQSLSDFIHYVEVRKDHLGVAWCTGSGVVFKRFVIEELGGWPTGSMAEDQLLSYMMNGIGYQTAYLHEFMQVGMVPETFRGHLKQRTRWAVGGLQTAHALRWGRYREDTKHMTFGQRWCLFVFGFITLITIPVFIGSLILPTLLYIGRPLLVFSTSEELRWQLRLCCILVWWIRVNEIVVALPAGYIQGQRAPMAWAYMVPYIAFSVLRCHVLPLWLGGTNMVFQPSGTVGDDLDETNGSKRSRLWTRIRTLALHCHAWFFVLFAVYCLGAVGLDWRRAWKVAKRSGDAKAAMRHLLVRSLLPPMWWLFHVIAHMVPIVCVLFPQRTPAMEEMMDFDPDTGVRQPRVIEVEQKWNTLAMAREICWAFAIGYCAVLFVGTFLW